MAILIFPRNERRYPIPFVIMNVALFFNASAQADIAEVQKFSPVNAT
jgi:hypothetical protein